MKRKCRCGESLLILFVLFIGGLCARGGPIVVGYTNCLAVTTYPQSLMDRIGQLKWYFAHASVGANMMDGIAALHAVNANFYPLRGVAADESPPSTTQTGVIYEHNRGNPGWWEKFELYQSCVSNGWRYPLVNLAMTKLCYIDQGAILDWCIDCVSPLASAFPETVFVYATMPLTTSEDSDNYDRNLYNDGLRDWCRTHNRVLLDIADIEAHDSNGLPVTFSYNNRVCQRLYDDYSSDGGHLNSAGSQLAAKGFYAVAAALMSLDRDGDGLSDGQELVAGTRPADPQSVLRLSGATLTPEGAVVLRWSSASNRLYTLQRGTSLMNGTSFTNLLLDATPTPPLNTFTDAPPGSATFFYRLQVRQ